MSQQHRHEYTAGLPHGLPVRLSYTSRKFPPPHGQRCALRPAQIRQVRAGGPGEGRKAPVPRVLLSATLAGPAPSGSTRTSRLCQGCSRPPRRHADQAAPSFSGLLRQATGEGLSPPHEPTAPHGANGLCARATFHGHGHPAPVVRLDLHGGRRDHSHHVLRPFWLVGVVGLAGVADQGTAAVVELGDYPLGLVDEAGEHGDGGEAAVEAIYRPYERQQRPPLSAACAVTSTRRPCGRQQLGVHAWRVDRRAGIHRSHEGQRTLPDATSIARVLGLHRLYEGYLSLGEAGRTTAKRAR